MRSCARQAELLPPLLCSCWLATPPLAQEVCHRWQGEWASWSEIAAYYDVNVCNATNYYGNIFLICVDYVCLMIIVRVALCGHWFRIVSWHGTGRKLTSNISQAWPGRKHIAPVLHFPWFLSQMDFIWYVICSSSSVINMIVTPLHILILSSSPSLSPFSSSSLSPSFSSSAHHYKSYPLAKD